MQNEKHLALSPYTALITDGDSTRLITGEGRWELDEVKLGRIAEWLAVAWQNVAGEGYQPVIITENGYVVQEGVVTKRAAAMPGLDSLENLERDCE